MTSLTAASNTIDQVLTDNRNALGTGMQGLAELGPVLQELRDTLVSIKRITRRLEDNPANYLMGREKIQELDRSNHGVTRMLQGPFFCGPRLRARLAVRLARMLILLSSCSMLPKTETLEIYQLPAASIAPSIRAVTLPWTLRISTPNSSQIIDSVRVLVLQHSNQVSAYKGARWTDPRRSCCEIGWSAHFARTAGSGR